jgi:acid phosphatase
LPNVLIQKDTLVAAKAHGFQLPPDIDDELLEDLAEVVTHEWFAGAMQNEEISRLSLGRLMGDIRDRMVRKVNGTDKLVGEQDLKMAIYSGHDT